MRWSPPPPVRFASRVREIDLEVAYPTLSVVVRDARLRRELARVELPYPTAGYGGHEIVVSPTERHAAVFLFSGQSEVGYELFELDPLRHITRLPYVHGHGDAPVFSPDGRWLAIVWDDADDAFFETPTAPVLARWAVLHLRDIETGDVTTHEIHVELPVTWKGADDAIPPPRAPRFGSNGTLHLDAPWAREIAVALPPPSRIVIQS